MSQFFYVDVDVKFAIFSHTENVKSHFLTQNMEFSNKTWNVARDLKKCPKYLKKHLFHTYKRTKHVALLLRLRSCIFGRPILKQNIVAKKCSIFDGSWTFQPIIPKLCFRARFVSSSLGQKPYKLLCWKAVESCWKSGRKDTLGCRKFCSVEKAHFLVLSKGSHFSFHRF